MPRPHITPRTGEFFELFAEAGANVLAAAKAGEARFRDFPGGTPQSRIEELEHEGDRLTGQLIGLINSQLITPYDRDDLFRLATAVDDVVDAIENATELLGLYDVEQPTRQSIEQWALLVECAEQLAALLGSLKGRRGLAPEIAEIKRLEDEGDVATRRAIGGLFDDERIDPLVVIRWKDIYQAIEYAFDACETTAHRIGNILVKNA